MANLDAEITQGTPPYSIVVRKLGELSGNRCFGDCTNFPVTFTEDLGSGNYYFLLYDGNDCLIDSRNLTLGVGGVNCDVTAPSYQYETTPIECVSNTAVNGNVRIYNISNVTRYKVCLGSTIFNCTPCTSSTGTINPGEEINVSIPVTTPGTNSQYAIRLYNGTACDVYSDVYGSMTTPFCTPTNGPDFTAAVINPTCSSESSGQLQNAILKLSGISNATRYKICFNSSTFNSTCVSGCANSDGVINSSAKDIIISAPAEGVSQTNTIRLFNGNSCNFFKDYTFSIYSQKCSAGELSMMTLDLQVFHNTIGGITAKCDVPSTYDVEYDFFITSTTPGMLENNQRVKTTSSTQRTLPNGNDVPNVFLAAGVKPICANNSSPNASINNMFYRYAFNLSLLKAKYPNINEFTFDVFALKTKDNNTSQFANKIRPVINAFKGVAMVKQWYNNNSNDAYREPLYNGDACRGTNTCGQQVGVDCCPDTFNVFAVGQADLVDVNYNTSIVGERKIGTIKYSYTTNKVTWIP